MTTATTVPPDETPDDASGQGPRIRLGSPTDLVAATPYLLHFHPADSVVVLAFRDRTYLGLARIDLPEPVAGMPDAYADSLLETARQRGATTVAIIGYGPADRVDPVVPAVHAAACRHGLQVQDALRVDGRRWWSYLCDDPRCCPPEGTPFDPTTSAVAAQCAFEGLPALPSRADLARQGAPAGGPARLAMDRATERAARRFRNLLAAVADDPDGGWRRRVLAEGAAAVEGALERYAIGGSLDDDELAWLGVLLTSLDVRDLAWAAIATVEPHRSLWSDAARRLDPSLAVPPLCLLAFTTWRFGEPVLAGMALERALTTDPDYPMANLLMQGLRQGPPPQAFDGWGTPAWRERLDRELQRDNPPTVRPHKPRRNRDRSRKPSRGTRRRT